jgi:hypothetical protein
MLDIRRFIGWFVTSWYAMLSPLPNSKTGGWGFESLHSCQGQIHRRAQSYAPWSLRAKSRMWSGAAY